MTAMRAGKIHPAICRGCGKTYLQELYKLDKPRFCSLSCRRSLDWRIDRAGPNGCWVWTGTKGDHGYGRAEGNRKVHTLIYEREIGPVPAGLELDHLCRNPSCCNPAHLEPVTRKVNVERQPRIINARRSAACCHGHPWTPENTYVHPRSGSRVCRRCTPIAQQKYLEKRSA